MFDFSPVTVVEVDVTVLTTDAVEDDGYSDLNIKYFVAPVTEFHDSLIDEDDAAVAVSPVGAESFVVVVLEPPLPELLQLEVTDELGESYP